MDRQIDRQTDRHIVRQIDRQERQTDKTESCIQNEIKITIVKIKRIISVIFYLKNLNYIVFRFLIEENKEEEEKETFLTNLSDLTEFGKALGQVLHNKYYFLNQILKKPWDLNSTLYDTF